MRVIYVKSFAYRSTICFRQAFVAVGTHNRNRVSVKNHRTFYNWYVVSGCLVCVQKDEMNLKILQFLSVCRILIQYAPEHLAKNIQQKLCSCSYCLTIKIFLVLSNFLRYISVTINFCVYLPTTSVGIVHCYFTQTVYAAGQKMLLLIFQGSQAKMVSWVFIFVNVNPLSASLTKW